jgi:hypothetical protein
LAATPPTVFNRPVIASACLWTAGGAAALACIARRRLAWAWLCVCTLGLAGWALGGGATTGAFWVALAGAFGVSLAASHPGLAEAALERPLRAWLGAARAQWPAPRYRWEAQLARDCPDWSLDPAGDRDAVPPPETRPEWLLPVVTARDELAERTALTVRALLPAGRPRRGGPSGPHALAFDGGLARWRWAARWLGARADRRPDLVEAHSWLLHGSQVLRAAGAEPDARARWESELALRRARAALERALAWRPVGPWARPLAGLWNRCVARCVTAPARSIALEAEVACLERARPKPTPVELPELDWIRRKRSILQRSASRSTVDAPGSAPPNSRANL